MLASSVAFATRCRRWLAPAVATSVDDRRTATDSSPMRAHPNAEKARLGATLNRLEPDPTTAPIVQRIFAERLAGRSYSRHRSRAQRRAPSPRPRQPIEPATRIAIRNGWAASRRARDPDATLATPATRSGTASDATTTCSIRPRRPTATCGACAGTHRDQWIWSPEPTHEALVDRDDWQRVQAMTTNREPRAPRRSRHDVSTPRARATAQSAADA